VANYNYHSEAEKGAQKKPFFTGRYILSQLIRFVNNFFLYFSYFLVYNEHKSKQIL